MTAAEAAGAAPPTLRGDARRIAPLAWPVFVGQVAVIAFSTVDTLLIARYAATDLAALAVGASAYITVFIGLMGVVLAIGPIVGQLFGAGRHAAAGAQLDQGLWLALGLAVIGSLLLAFPQPFLWLARAPAEVATKVRSYTLALAFSLPASLLFTVYRGFNIAVSRPKAVMALQLGGLALKLPLTAAFVFGWGPLPELGVAGCGIATAIAMWAQAGAAWLVLRRDRFYERFEIRGRRLQRPSRAALAALLALGVPMGLSIAVEVTGFTFMAFFVSRISTLAVAGHQIAANLAALLFMMPLALANASSTLVAQRIGAGDLEDARGLARHGPLLGLGLASMAAIVVALGRDLLVRLYTHDALVIAAALPLVAWLGLFHIFDAAQTIAAFVLRAWRVATVPFAIYAASVWGIGLGGGWALVFGFAERLPAWSLPYVGGARGFWAASTLGLLCASGGLLLMLRHVQRSAGHARQATRPRD